MRYAILGDIHANVTALEAVFDCIRGDSVDRVISVGDVVGYGPSPSACIRMLEAEDAVVVKGNHDAACVRELDIRYFNNYARIAVEWTRSQLSASEQRWLAELPLTVELEDCEVAHGSLFRPELFNYTQSTTDADPSLDIMKTPVCFVGHTHIPVVLWRLKERGDHTRYEFGLERVDLGRASHSLINVGSVGQPRDEDPRTAYAVYDSSEQTFSLHRIEYDIEREVSRFQEAGLPEVLANRLFLGV